MQFRTATPSDAPTLARLHTLSWQNSYRGILTDQYLDHDIHADMQQKWSKRFANPNPKQWALIASDAAEEVGFVCTLLAADLKWGALLDNLHVLKSQQGKGLGAYLLYASAKWVEASSPDSGMYLWVYVDNPAVQFYENMGGVRKERITVDNPGGGQADIYRYVWDDLKAWLKDNVYLENRF
ncbi:MAG: GNAT family N-acetyltransferase [Bacteroidota bacterium]